jgi:hypothetical protein
MHLNGYRHSSQTWTMMYKPDLDHCLGHLAISPLNKVGQLGRSRANEETHECG